MKRILFGKKQQKYFTHICTGYLAGCIICFGFISFKLSHIKYFNSHRLCSEFRPLYSRILFSVPDMHSNLGGQSIDLSCRFRWRGKIRFSFDKIECAPDADDMRKYAIWLCVIRLSSRHVYACSELISREWVCVCVPSISAQEHWKYQKYLLCLC